MAYEPPRGSAWNPPTAVLALWKGYVDKHEGAWKKAHAEIPQPKPAYGLFCKIMERAYGPSPIAAVRMKNKLVANNPPESSATLASTPNIVPRPPTFTATNGNVPTAGHIARADRAIALIRDVIRNARATGQSASCEPVFSMIDGILAMV